MTQQINLSNIVNVNISQVPLGLTASSVNVGCILTYETPNNPDIFRIYVDAPSVGTDYGTSSSTYQMAANIFAQQPNILAGNGALVIAPFNASNTSATQGEFVTANIAANIANFQSIVNGVLKVTLNGAIIQLANLNFTNISTLADIANVLQIALPDAIVSATTTEITIQSKKVGATSAVLLATGSGLGTDLTGATYLDIAAGIATSGADAILNETPVNAIARLLNLTSFYWVITNLELSDSQCETLASSVQSYSRTLMFLHHFATTSSFAGIGATVVSAKQDQFRCLYYGIDPVSANLMKSAYCGRMFSVDYTASNTALSAQLKQLTNVVADPSINQTVLIQALNAGMNVYVSTGGYVGVISSTQFAQCANNFFDNVYNEIWLKLNIQIAGFNAFVAAGSKLPQTEQGMIILKNALAKILAQGVVNGVIGTGITWNGPTFGNQASLIQNTFDTGYYIYSLPVSQQSTVQRATRQAPPIQIAIQLAGAIESVGINVNIAI